MSSQPPVSPNAAVVAPVPARRILELDALRALAALNLMLFHFTWVYSEKYGFASEIPLKYAYGKYGTQLFFMLSGLVNAMTLFRKQDAGSYIESRVIRILPPFLLVLGLNLWLVQLEPLRRYGQWTWDSVLANMTLLPNLWGYECLEPVTWTLQIEIQFYAVFLLMFVVGALRRPFWPLIGCLLFCCGFGTALNHLTPDTVGSGDWQVLLWLKRALIIEFFPLFAMGIFIYLGFCEKNQWFKNGLGIAVSVGVFHAIEQRHSSPLATILLIALLIASQYGRLPILRTRPLLFVSGISYSLFLLHNNLGSVLIYQLHNSGVSPLASVFVASIIVIGLAAAAAAWIERPLAYALRSLLTRLRGRPRAVATDNLALISSQPTP